MGSDCKPRLISGSAINAAASRATIPSRWFRARLSRCSACFSACCNCRRSASFCACCGGWPRSSSVSGNCGSCSSQPGSRWPTRFSILWANSGRGSSAPKKAWRLPTGRAADTAGAPSPLHSARSFATAPARVVLPYRSGEQFETGIPATGRRKFLTTVFQNRFADAADGGFKFVNFGVRRHPAALDMEFCDFTVVAEDRQ